MFKYVFVDTCDFGLVGRVLIICVCFWLFKVWKLVLGYVDLERKMVEIGNVNFDV